MKKTEGHLLNKWPPQQFSSREEQHCLNHTICLRKTHPSQCPVEMINGLKGYFCKGRYRSWVLAQNKHTG